MNFIINDVFKVFVNTFVRNTNGLLRFPWLKLDSLVQCGSVCIYMCTSYHHVSSFSYTHRISIVSKRNVDLTPAMLRGPLCRSVLSKISTAKFCVSNGTCCGKLCYKRKKHSLSYIRHCIAHIIRSAAHWTAK